MTQEEPYEFAVLSLMCALQECDLLPGLSGKEKAKLSQLKNSALEPASGENFVVVYRSTALISSQKDLNALLDHSRANNAAKNITGIMLYYDMTFFQVLEGDEQAVRNLLDTISKDPRHTMMEVVFTRSAHRRVFGDWSMEMIDVSPEDLDNILSSLSDYGPTAQRVMQAMQA